MKTSAIARRILMMLTSFFMAAFAFAQNEIGVDINAKDSGFPWIWVVGAAVFVLLLVALMRGGSRSEG